MTDRIVTLRDNSNNKVYPVGFAPAGAVTTSMYTDASITTPKLADGSVTTSKLANNSVTADKLAPGVAGTTLDEVYPVGTIYSSSSSTNPATLFGGTWEQLTFDAQSGQMDGSNLAGGASRYYDYQITTNGNPVFLSFCADANPEGTGSMWYDISILRDNVVLDLKTAQGDGASSHNFNTAIIMLDTPSAGTHVYRFNIHNGGGVTLNFKESGTTGQPRWAVYELGYPAAQYTWKRTA